MAFVKYENLTTPDEVIEKIHDYVKTVGSTVSDPLRGDTDIFTRTENDGKRFTFQDNRQEYYVTLRSANGTQIFGVNDDAEQDVKPVEKHKGYHGIGMVVSEGYSKTQRWYNQFNVPLKFKDKEVQGTWMPVSTGLEDLEEVKKPDEVEEPAPQEAPQMDTSEADAIPKVDKPIKPVGIHGDFLNTKPTMLNYYTGVDDIWGSVEGIRANSGKIIKDQWVKGYHEGLANTGLLISFAFDSGITPKEYLDKYFNGDLELFKKTYRYTYQITKFGYYPNIKKLGNFWVVFSESVWDLMRTNSDVSRRTARINYENKYGLSSLSAATALNGYYGYTIDQKLPTFIDDYLTKLTVGNKTLGEFINLSKEDAFAANNGSGGVFDLKTLLTQKVEDFMGIAEKYKNKRAYAYHVFFENHLASGRDCFKDASMVPQERTLSFMLLLDDDAYQYILDCGQAIKDFCDMNSSFYNSFKEKIKNYDKDLAKYNEYLAKYQEAIKRAREKYNALIVVYNKYLADIAKYKEYLRLKALYEEYLRKVEELKNTYTLYCNHIIAPSETFLFSLVKQNKNDKRFFQTTHLAFGTLVKYEAWNGGAWFSGSANRHMMQTAYLTYADDDIISDRFTRPLLSSGEETTTFVRCDIDEAPLDIRGHILWASSGTDNITGKKLSLPIRTGDNMNGVIPNYRYMQSLGRLEWGRNINTLNGITVDMPIFFAVKVDPEELDLYAAIGHATGIYFLCMLNMQTAGVYERSYPKSGIQNQVFSVGRRRGNWGFDGIGIAQEDTVKE
jgi:hypothetical protein|nr:MAG TPA: hypothetical protein [Caudoviricetes sp.]